MLTERNCFLWVFFLFHIYQLEKHQEVKAFHILSDTCTAVQWNIDLCWADSHHRGTDKNDSFTSQQTYSYKTLHSMGITR